MDLCDRREIQALLERHGFHFSKAMGQNFLIESWVPRDIADSCGADAYAADGVKAVKLAKQIVGVE